MRSPKVLSAICCLLAGLAAAAQVMAQAQAPARKVDKSSGYYHYALGHLYAELASAYGNRGEYLNKAIESYRAAIKADPTATFISEELSDLYVQSGRLREAVVEAEEAIRQNPSDVNSRRILGRIYMRMIGDPQQGKLDEKTLKLAIDQYQKIAELTPKDLDSWLILGRLQKVAQNSVEAENAYKKALELEPANEDALTGLAMVYSDLGDNKRAADMLKQVADKSPSLRTLTALAQSYEQMREFALAAETLRRSLELSPKNLDIKRAYAQDLLYSDQLNEALKVFDEILKEDPKDAQSQLRVSQIYRQKRDFAKAREAARKAQELDPNSLEIKYNEVNLLEAEGKTAEAVAALKEVIQSNTKKTYSTGERNNRVLLMQRLGMLQRASEQYAEAAETFRQVAEIDPDAGAQSSAQIVETFRAAKDLKRALAEADAAQKKYPSDRVLRAVRASVLAELGRHEEAASELKSLLDGKSDRETWVSLAQVYEKGKNYPEMEKAIAAAEKLSNTKEEKESIAFMRGAMYERLKKFDLAEQQFRIVLELNPENASALNYLGYMLADRNIRLQEAHQLISKAVEAEPNNGAYLDSLGWVYYRMDKLPEAETYLRKAIERFSKDPTVHDHLGDVLFRQGKVREAITHWQRSLAEWASASPSETDHAEVAKVQKKLDNAKVRQAKEQSGGQNKQH